MSTASKNNPGLDMRHGFIHHIRRNQQKRDEYDKECEKVVCTKSKPSKQETPKYPDQQVYRPKTSPKENGENSAEQSKRGSEKLLYNLEYTDNSGVVHKIPVHKNGDPKVIAQRLSTAAKVPNELFETLEWKIKQEILKRNVQ